MTRDNTTSAATDKELKRLLVLVLAIAAVSSHRSDDHGRRKGDSPKEAIPRINLFSQP
jgi:hypothetical protein